MNVQSTNSTALASGGATAGSSSAKQTIGGDDFVKLLMAELKNQDPTQPMDPTQMVSQLATVSQVAQMSQMNTTLAQLLATSSLSQAGQIVGRVVSNADGSLSGRVTSASVGSGGIVATLDNGAQLSLQDGVKISA